MRKKWCVYVHNIASYKKLDWRSTLEVSEGFTQDIPKFCFHIREKMFYFKKVKAPENIWQPGRWTGFEDSTGDEMCHYIRTEGKKTCYLIWSVIFTRGNKIGTDKEYVNNDTNNAP